MYGHSSASSMRKEQKLPIVQRKSQLVLQKYCLAYQSYLTRFSPQFLEESGCQNTRSIDTLILSLLIWIDRYFRC